MKPQTTTSLGLASHSQSQSDLAVSSSSSSSLLTLRLFIDFADVRFDNEKCFDRAHTKSLADLNMDGSSGSSSSSSASSSTTTPATQARIQFKALKGFPDPSNDKVETQAFLNAAKEIVTVIESFGKLFTPVISDMNGNINKLTKAYGADVLKYKYLEDLIILNVNVDDFAANALLWLKRGLQLICTFFENIYNDAQNTEALKQHLQNAYERTLKPYHGFIVQSTIKIIYSWVPTRSQLLGQGACHDENIEVLTSYLPTMRTQLDRVDALLKEHNLDDKRKV